MRKARVGRLALLSLFALGLGFTTLAGRADDAVAKYRVPNDGRLRARVDGVSSWLTMQLIDCTFHGIPG